MPKLVTRHTPHVTGRHPLVTRHTSHVTGRHPLVTRHTPHITALRPAPHHSLKFQVSSFSPPRKRSAFTLIEILVVIAIIAILAGLAFPAISSALTSAKKAEVRSMANQIKLALSSYYAEYGTYPAVTNASAQFVQAMSGSNNVNAIPNRRGVRFLELNDKWTNADGIVTPQRFYGSDGGRREVFRIATDTNYDGRLDFNPGAGQTNMGGSIAVWVPDPTASNRVIGTW